MYLPKFEHRRPATVEEALDFSSAENTYIQKLLHELDCLESDLKEDDTDDQSDLAVNFPDLEYEDEIFFNTLA